MDRNLALEFVRVTEAAAIEAARWIGRGDKNKADGAAVNAMRARLNQIDFSGTVVIGEGKKDEAPMLFTGEKVGKGNNPQMDLAIDPLECTESVAHGRYNALSVIAAGPKNSLLSAPDTYMEKLAVGKEAAKVIDLNASIKVNLKKIAKALGKTVSEVSVVVLDRPRHEKLIKEIRAAGARVARCEPSRLRTMMPVSCLPGPPPCPRPGPGRPDVPLVTVAGESGMAAEAPVIPCSASRCIRAGRPGHVRQHGENSGAARRVSAGATMLYRTV